jgi:hypothetical protein
MTCRCCMLCCRPYLRRAVQALDAERKRASEAVAAAMHDAKSEHAGRLLKLEQERSAAISALEEENVQLRLELGNQLADANVRRACRHCLL